jgi:predicted  nucleic acid-binding Zn-ribbon protein
MEDNPELLMGLQDLDGRIDRLTREMEEIPREKRIHEKEMESHREAFERERNRSVSLAKLKDQATAERDATLVHMAEFKTKLLEMKTNEAYRAMVQQIRYAENKIGELDIRMLELMYEEETVAKDLEDARRTFERNSARTMKRSEILDGQLEGMKERMAELQSERERASSLIGQRLLDRYERVRKSGKGLVVVGLLNGSCGGCHTNVPPQTVVEISQGKFFQCPICGRYIIWTEGRSFAGAGN